MRRTDGELLMFWTIPAVGVLWVVCFFLFPGFVDPLPPTLPAEDVARFYQDNAARIQGSMIVFNWVGAGLIPVLMLLVMQVRRMAHRTPILAYCLIGVAAGGPTLFLCANLFWLVAAFRPDRAAESTQMLNDLAWLTFTSTVPFLIAQSLFLAVAIYLDQGADRVLARWVAHFNLLVAAAYVPAAFSPVTLSGPFAWDGALSFWLRNAATVLWIVVMAVVVGRNLYGERRAAVPTTEVVPA